MERLIEGVKPFDIKDDILNQWQEIANAMAQILDVPAGLIMRLNDKDIEVYTASTTENNPFKVKDALPFFDCCVYCEITVTKDEKLHVPYAPTDDYWKDTPAMGLNMSSYMGYPIKHPGGMPFGTICVLDDHERHYTEAQEMLMIQFRNMVESHLELISISNDLESLNKRTKTSITFASQIQQSLLSNTKLLNTFFKNHFVIWEPKDIVSGDIYFVNELPNNKLLIIFVDCTGHGVAGSMVTMIVKSITQQINSILIDKPDVINVSDILSTFNVEMQRIFSNENDTAFDFAGFDGAVLCVDKNNKSIDYSGAKMPLYIVNNERKLNTIKADKYSVGYQNLDVNYKFTKKKISYEDFDTFYLCTDGYIDQTGGKNGFSFGRKAFEEIIIKHNNEPLSKQKEILMHSFNAYKRDEEQIDDVTLLGFTL